ncbi:DUF3108 domain-containing protein [Pseudorhodoferax sp. Leaf267]|uniref:DUF3108 domain-containing protein n=1 Tax=Pseudorhodoferax sp. Leaf267 TaxID=1736316 RepID=UPI00071446DA|nr:DUF3108 domain-containing protein [Pseudorhodoferax sp. Leaf267]KQP12560.1 hypothetical protein ASF43_20125 [Pseudorhodoferax sp. Leaf267]
MQRTRSAAEGLQDTTKPRGDRRALGFLALGVVVAHLALLQNLPDALAPPDPLKTRAFTTRSIVLQPPPVMAVAPPPEPVAAPAPRPRPRPSKPRPPAAEPAPEPLTLAPPEPAPDITGAEPTVDATAQAEPAEPAASQPQELAAIDPQPAIQAPPPAEPTPPATLALAIPGSMRLKYTLTGEAKKQTYHAMGEFLWLQDGKTYDARLEYSAFLIGSRVRTSTGQITGRGLAPDRFSDKWRKRDLAAHFERDKNQVSFSANTPVAPLLPDAQDQLSVLLQLASMVAGDPGRYGPGTTLTLPVVGPRDADTWAFTLQGEERIYLPLGEMPTIKLTRNPRKEFDQKVEAWLAPSLAYMPVQLRITQPNGDFVEQQLRAVDTP